MLAWKMKLLPLRMVGDLDAAAEKKKKKKKKKEKKERALFARAAHSR